MPLRLLVIGRERDDFTTAGGHTLTFAPDACAPGGSDASFKGAAQLFADSIDFVLYHTSNSEYRTAIGELAGDGQYSSKVIAFSGGAAGYRHPGVPTIGNVVSVVTGLAWERVPANFKGNATELAALLTPRTSEVAGALLVLCQGYLAVHAEKCLVHGKETFGPPEIAAELGAMGWNDEVYGLCGGDKLIAKRELVQGPGWWTGVFQPDGLGKVLAALKEELPDLDVESGASPVSKFLTRLFTQQGKADNPAEVACVYRELSERFLAGSAK